MLIPGASQSSKPVYLLISTLWYKLHFGSAHLLHKMPALFHDVFDTAIAHLPAQPGVQQLRTSVASTKPGSPTIAALSAVGMVVVALTATAPAGVPRNRRSSCTCARGGPQKSQAAAAGQSNVSWRQQ